MEHLGICSTCGYNSGRTLCDIENRKDLVVTTNVQICLTNCDDTIVHLGFITVIAIPFFFFFFFFFF